MTFHLSGFQLIIACAVVLFSIFIQKLVRHRLAWRRSGIPGPSHSFWWGHMLEMNKYEEATKKKIGPKAHVDATAAVLSQTFGEGCVALDFWPLADPFVIITDPQLADRIVRVENLPKTLSRPVIPIVTTRSIIQLKGDENDYADWHALRKAFAPVFSKGKLERSWTGDIARLAERLVARFSDAAASGAVLKLNEEMNDITIDVILRVTLGSSDEGLRKSVIEILRAQIDESATFNLIFPFMTEWNPMYRWRTNRRSRAMNELLRPIVDEHIRNHGKGAAKEKMDLLDGGLSQSDEFSSEDHVVQVRSFLLAGSESTALSLAWTLYYLYHPDAKHCLRRIRDEHDRVFGKDSVGDEGRLLSATPSMLNDLKYTTAALREAVRLNPAASVIRRSTSADPYSYELNDKRYTLVGSTFLWVCHYAMQRHPANYPEPESFKPERFIDDSGELIAPSMAWQSFGRGPRVCIGLELAMLEMKIILAMIIRKFDFEYADSEEPYQTYHLAAKPHNGIPVKVKLS